MPEKAQKGTVNIMSFNYDDGNEVFTTESSSFKSDSYIIANSKNLFVKLLLVLKAYFGIIALAFIFYFLKRIFFSLKGDLSFNLFLYKNVKRLGIVIVIKVALELTVSYVYSTYYGLIRTETLVDNKTFSGGIRFSINPRLDFEFSLFLVGLTLIVLASLLKAGNSIQQENKLTI